MIVYEIVCEGPSQLRKAMELAIEVLFTGNTESLFTLLFRFNRYLYYHVPFGSI